MKTQIILALLAITLAACAPAITTVSTETTVPTATSTIVPPTSTSLTATGKQPPACAFPLAQATMEESKPEEYTFSEPRVVLNAQGNPYNIVEWLPDNQQVLMAQDMYSTRESERDKFLRQSIELYNPVTGESKVYAIRHYIEEPPVWQPELNAVVYPAMNFMGIDENTHGPKFTRQIWVSYGNPDTVQMLADKLPQFFLAIKPGSSEMIYLSDKKISKLDKSLKEFSSASFDSVQWDYAKGEEMKFHYHIRWLGSLTRR